MVFGMVQSGSLLTDLAAVIVSYPLRSDAPDVDEGSSKSVV